MLLDSIFGFPRTPVQRVYNWDCIMPDVWGAGILGIAVSKYCQSVTIGEYNIDDIAEMKVAAFKKFFAGVMNIQNPKATFIAPVPDIVSNYFHTWKKLIIDDRGFYHKAADYKKNIYVVLYDRSGIPANMITLVGAYPKTFPAWNLVYGSEEVVKYDIEFKVDNILTGLGAFSSFGSAAAGAISTAAKAAGRIFKK
jgi:hypothetical protein